MTTATEILEIHSLVVSCQPQQWLMEDELKEKQEQEEEGKEESTTATTIAKK